MSTGRPASVAGTREAAARVPAPAGGRLAARLRDAAEVLALGLLCALSLGPAHLLPGAAALGHETRDLFDHLALLDAWALSLPHQAFPDGGSFFPPDLSGMVLAAPLLALGLPRAAAWNAVLLLQLWLAAAAAWALGRRYGAGLVAGVAYGLSPYLLGQALTGEAETIAAWPLPLMALALERAADTWRGRGEGSPDRALVAAGLCGAAAALGAWYHGAFAALWMGGWLLARAWSPGRAFQRRALLAPVTFALAVAPAAALYASILAADDQLFRGPAMADYLDRFPRSLARMVVDPAALFGAPVAGAGHVDALSRIAVGLALLGLVLRPARGERAGWWWALLLGALSLALGPVLHWKGAAVWAWMPYRLLAELPVFGLMRLPHRWMLVGSLALAVLAARAVAALADRGATELRWLVPLLLWGEVTWFLVPQRPAVSIEPPAVVARIDGPVLDLPPRTLGQDARGRYLVWQREHGQPIAYTLLMQAMGPSVAAEPLVAAVAAADGADPIGERVPDAAQFRQEAFAREVAAWRAGSRDPALLEGAADRLRALGFTQVVLHGPLLDEGARAEILALLQAQLGAPTEQVEGAWRWVL
ncbi:hypothetical protein L6R53_30520 [Myxococcota bacterium]|nr:hypothetical protein [Myxococcota bacterium]